AGSKDNDFFFDDGNRLSGTIRDAKGNALPDVMVYLEKDNQIWSRETNNSGEYQFDALEKGTYLLSYGKTNYIYTEKESIEITENTVKDMVLTGFSVTDAYQITYSISMTSPVESGGEGTVKVSAVNQKDKEVKGLILEVNVPAGVIIEDSMLGKGQTYHSEERKITMTVNLGESGSLYTPDYADFRFNYKLEDGYPKNKVIFTAYAKDAESSGGTALKEYEMTDLDWARTDEKQTFGRMVRSPIWKWSDLSGLTTTITDEEKVWDGLHNRYFESYDSNTSKDYATWAFHNVIELSPPGPTRPGELIEEIMFLPISYEYRRFQSEFSKPEKEYNFSHILSENYAAYSGSGAVFPINDEIFMFVYPKGTTVTDTNAGNYLAFWGSTKFSEYPKSQFMGVTGNEAIWYKKTGNIPAMAHTDCWVLDGTKNRIKEILDQYPDSTDFVIDVFTSDYNEGGGMDKFQLVFTNTEIPSLDSKKPSMPYYDFIGSAYADVFKPTLTGDECVTVSFTQSNEYLLRGQSMKSSDVTIHRLFSEDTIPEFHTDEGYYRDKGTLLPSVPGTYPFIAECKKGGAVRYSNIHVVEVIGDINLSIPLRLTSATINRETQISETPYIISNTIAASSYEIRSKSIAVGTTFTGLQENDEIYYQTTDFNESFRADEKITALLPMDNMETKYISVDVVRDGTVVFSRIIGCIYVVIDPSGYVYDKHTGERIEGAVVTCYVQGEDGEWEIWKAENYGQANPLITDEDGKYAWDVPDGVYKVTVSIDGYDNYDTLFDTKFAFDVGKVSSIVIPPPRLDINMGIKNISKPILKESFPENETVISPEDVLRFTFNKAMDAESLTNGIVIKKDSQNIDTQVR
ncbi:MAG: carboxypeptidase-like regulatory domain-containing protein, partial [Lachnoclostridium sp.]|nr:carboxypeptidase-like regulatory domain-containing protein [Lachnoclostridium sp.]